MAVVAQVGIEPTSVPSDGITKLCLTDHNFFRLDIDGGVLEHHVTFASFSLLIFYLLYMIFNIGGSRTTLLPDYGPGTLPLSYDVLTCANNLCIAS
jgi:hypothetical protein